MSVAVQAATNSVTLTWTAPGDDGSQGTATVYDIRYSTSNISSEADWINASQATGEPVPQPAGTEETFTVTGLQSNTTYYFAIKVADEVPNWSGISNIRVAATDAVADEIGPDAVGTLAAGGATSSSIALGWIATGDDGSSGTAAGYDIRFSTSPINEGNWGAAVQVTGEPSPQSAGTPQGMVVTGLNPTTTYYFAMKVSDEVPNWSPLSNVVSLATTNEADGGEPAAIVDLTAASGSASGHLDLDWTAVGDDGMVGTAAGYIIKVSTSLITPANWDAAIPIGNPPAPLPAGSQQSWTITGLTPALRYYVAVKAIDDAANQSEMSNVVTAIAGWEFGLDIEDDESSLPDGFHLSQNYPNPFNPSTTIEYAVGEGSRVSLQVYNVSGQLVATLVDRNQVPGEYAVEWNGMSADGRRAASGVYFYRLEAAGFTQTQKMVLLK
jgi:hypothetical protein